MGPGVILRGGSWEEFAQEYPAHFPKLTAALEETLKRLRRVRLVALYTGSGYAGWT